MTSPKEKNWLLLIHQIPPKPSYFRVKIWRRLQQLGAVAVKNSVYVLPKNDANYESFQWIMREINQGKGDASVCEAQFLEGLSDQTLEQLFIDARNQDYAALTQEVREIGKKLGRGKLAEEKRKEVENLVARAKHRLEEIQEIDFFSGSGRESAQGLLSDLESRLRAETPGMAKLGTSLVSLDELKGRTWVTRRGIHVDRIASAWLIQRFIDPKAKFKFVGGKIYKPQKGELRFDMFDAEFTHVGDSCSFEVLIARTNLKEAPLREIAEIIHELDIGDEKYIRGDAEGIKILINGICANHKSDEDRLSAGSSLFNNLYEYFSKKRRSTT